MTSYSDDNKMVWRDFRRECISIGIKSDDIQRNRTELRRFFYNNVTSRNSASKQDQYSDQSRSTYRQENARPENDSFGSIVASASMGHYRSEQLPSSPASFSSTKHRRNFRQSYPRSDDESADERSALSDERLRRSGLAGAAAAGIVERIRSRAKHRTNIESPSFTLDTNLPGTGTQQNLTEELAFEDYRRRLAQARQELGHDIDDDFENARDRERRRLQRMRRADIAVARAGLGYYTVHEKLQSWQFEEVWGQLNLSMPIRSNHIESELQDSSQTQTPSEPGHFLDASRQQQNTIPAACRLLSSIYQPGEKIKKTVA